MIEVKLSREVDVPAALVWPILENFGDISWAPGIEKVDVIGEGIGMIRRIYMPNMEPIDEQLMAMDGAAMSLSYEIPRGLPMPMSNYSASGQVVDLGEGRCRLNWVGRCQPEAGLSEAEATQIVEGTYVMLLDWIAAEAEKRAG